MQFSPEQFNELKREAEAFYATFDKVHCPYLGDDVHFNAKGLEHLVFKSWNRTRPVADQYTRFRHLGLAPDVIRLSRTLQGVWKTQKFERIKRKTGWVQVLKLTTYYEFIAVLDSRGSKVRVKVIVKEIDGGEKFFLSIIPFWGIDKRTGERVLYNGNPELD